MKNDAEVERNQTPDTKQQTALKMAEDFLEAIPYLAVKLSKDEITKRFGEEWENVLDILEEQDVIVAPCAVYEHKTYKLRFIDALEEKSGYKFQPKLDEEGKIINPILRERYEAARIQADEFTASGWVRANLPEDEIPNVLGKDWRIVLRILQNERNFRIKPYEVWKRSGFLGLKKELVGWKYLITTPETENAN